MTADRLAEHDPQEPTHAAGWVARRLGITPATLRIWQYRYGIGPTARTAGGHRRYSRADVARLEHMRELVLAGIPVGQAAQMSGGSLTSSPAEQPIRRRGGGRVLAVARDKPELQRLAGAVMALDESTMDTILTDALGLHGVIPTWDELIVPILRSIGERYRRSAGCIDVEHLFTERVRLALSAVTADHHRWDAVAPVLLSCPDTEQHVLPLYALAAALAELAHPSRVLGASVPTAALASAVRRIKPSAVFVWAQTEQAAQHAALAAIPRQRPPARIVVGGPGWDNFELPENVTRVAALTEAVHALR